MNLDVNGEIIAEPKAGDISRAVDGRTDDISWYLVLTRPDGFYLELLPVEDGLFKLASGNEAQKLRQRSEDTIDPAKAKEVLQNFLIGGASWRALMPRGPGPERATQPTKTGMDTYSGRQMGWIAAVIGIGGAAYLFQLVNPLYVLIFMYGSIVGLMILFKSSQEIEVRRRPKAAGSVTKSALQYRRQRFERERTRLDNAPDVEYRFQVGGEAYLGARVGLNTEYASENVAEIVRRYPVGSIVQVAYNPKDPTDCLLEPGANTAMFRQILLLAAIPTGLALAVVYTTPRVQPWLLDRYPQAHPLHVVIAAVLALYMTPMYLRSLLIGPPRSAPWAETPGKVVFAEVEAVVGERAAG
jgi:hypothetical protein